MPKILFSRHGRSRSPPSTLFSHVDIDMIEILHAPRYFSAHDIDYYDKYLIVTTWYRLLISVVAPYSCRYFLSLSMMLNSFRYHDFRRTAGSSHTQMPAGGCLHSLGLHTLPPPPSMMPVKNTMQRDARFSLCDAFYDAYHFTHVIGLPRQLARWPPPPLATCRIFTTLLDDFKDIFAMIFA